MWPTKARNKRGSGGVYYNYFTSKVENFDIEMENSSMEVVNYLLTWVEQRKQG